MDEISTNDDFFQVLNKIFYDLYVIGMIFAFQVGFWHEHTRPDRDDWVTIIRENIMVNINE